MNSVTIHVVIVANITEALCQPQQQDSQRRGASLREGTM